MNERKRNSGGLFEWPSTCDQCNKPRSIGSHKKCSKRRQDAQKKRTRRIMSRVYKKSPEQTSKTCSGCSVEKPSSDFYKQPSGRLKHLCKPCWATHNREQRAKHHEKRKSYEASRGPGWERSGRAKYKPPEPERWAAYIKRKYGIERDQFQQMLEEQEGVCAICRQECNRSTTTRMCIDHDHSTGKVRGLLCFQCNVGLGKFKDDTALLRTAIEYLQRSSS